MSAETLPLEQPLSTAVREHPSLRVAARTRERFFALDYLRFVAMIDIVSMHSVGDHLLHGIGLPMLLLISAGLQAGRVPPAAPSVVAARRSRRLLIPWVFWSLVYAAWLVAMSRSEGRGAFDWFHPRMLLYGPVIHLWFVPFLFLTTPVVAILAQSSQKGKLPPALAASAVTGVLILLLCAAIRVRVNLPEPFNQWVFSLAAIPLGIAVGLTLAAGPESRTAMLLPLVLAGVAIAAIGVELVPLPFACDRWMLRRFGLALGAVCLFACLRGRDDPLRRLFVRTTFGVFLVHPLIFLALREAGVITGFEWTDFVVVYALSMLAALGMHAARLSRLI